MTCNNAAFSWGTLPGMGEMHETMTRLYKAAAALRGQVTAKATLRAGAIVRLYISNALAA